MKTIAHFPNLCTNNPLEDLTFGKPTGTRKTYWINFLLFSLGFNAWDNERNFSSKVMIFRRNKQDNTCLTDDKQINYKGY
ncbi:hypothetical protein D7D25_02655 [Proteiniphilum sp. X52]|nr:hypothetical protein D7D25_02655 [Proteiniphilum sp. X52]